MRRIKKREELGIPRGAILLLSVGELNQNKNHETIVHAIEKIEKQKNIFYMVAGKGELKEHLQAVIDEVGVTNRVKLLGYRKDIPELCLAADIFCFPSYREGLGLAAIEAMACGLLIVTSNMHGINDYSEQGVTGFKCAPSDIEGFTKAIVSLTENPEVCKIMAKNNKLLAQKYSVEAINKMMMSLYETGG